MKKDESCEFCGDVTQAIFLLARCHPTAPLMAKKEGDVLILLCYIPECAREVARFNLVKED
jgi:hypothetical protein